MHKDPTLGTRRFVLLDRDGTINEEREYISDPAQVALLQGAAEGLRLLKTAGFGLVIISNQSGVGRGYFTSAQVEAVNARLLAILARESVELDGIYFCPHAPASACDCRKPATGMVRAAAADLGFDPNRCFVVGDKAIDMALGRRIGATTILVRTGYGAAQAEAAKSDTDHIVDDLRAAAKLACGLVASNFDHARG